MKGDGMTAPAELLAKRFANVLSSPADLRAVYAPPSEAAANKDIGFLDAHSRAFLARSPFVLLGTSGADGAGDVSPKGDRPGFVHIIDDQTLAIPDRLGNRRIDSLFNIVANPHVGLLFLTPGLCETLRVNGAAIIARDEGLLDTMSVDGKRPNVAIVVAVEECYMHCAKALLRSDLWNPATCMERSSFPSLARIMHDQRRPPDVGDDEHEGLVKATEARHAEAYERLY